MQTLKTKPRNVQLKIDIHVLFSHFALIVNRMYTVTNDIGSTELPFEEAWGGGGGVA